MVIAPLSFALLLIASSAHAHPEGFSGLRVLIEDERVVAELTLHTRDLSVWFPPGRYPNYVADVCAELERDGAGLVEIYEGDASEPLIPVRRRAFAAEVGLLQLELEFASPAASQVGGILLIWSRHFDRLPRGHQQILSVEDRRGVPSVADQSPIPGVLLSEALLDVEQDAIECDVPAREGAPPVTPESSSASAAPAKPANAANVDAALPPMERGEATPHVRRQAGISFLKLGVEHILTGYDHLLFLTVLLIGCVKFRDAAWIITCFTLAHSITLALATLDVVRAPEWLVEPIIALSIVVAAVENLFGTPPLGRRAVLTFSFGLIHGLGFASVLRDLGLGERAGGVVWPLVRFNLGVEAGQLLVAVPVAGLLWQIRRRPEGERRLLPALSLVLACVGAYWLVSRLAFS